jgi:predicted amidohydrolase
MGVTAKHPALTVATAQPLCVAYDVEANARAHAASVREAGARVVVFPELSLTGYELDAPVVALDDPRLAPLVEACRETGAVALAGAPVSGEAGEHIAILAIGDAGVTVAYRKMCIGGNEPDRFSPGAEPAAIEVDGWRLGLGICKDTRIREQTAATAALGIDVYVAGVCEKAEDAGLVEERARRIVDDDGVAVAIASFAGSAGGGYDPTAGRSAIWSNDGTLLAQAGRDPGELARAVLQPGLGVEARYRTVGEAVLDRRVLTASLGTLPRPDGADLRWKLRQIRDVFDFVKFGDNPRARARVSPWAAAAVALGEGIEPIVHVGCRDRNRLALQSDLLGGRLLGVRNALCLRGDEIDVSNQREARGVRDLDVVDLIGLAARDFCVLAACDPAVEVNDEHADRLRTKIVAGAQLLETQPVFEADRFALWLRQLRGAGIDVPVLVDVPVAATRAEAELLQRIPYVAAPPDLPVRLGRDPDAGIALAAELVGNLLELEGVAGCHLSLIGGDPGAPLAVVERLR